MNIYIIMSQDEKWCYRKTETGRWQPLRSAKFATLFYDDKEATKAMEDCATFTGDKVAVKVWKERAIESWSSLS